MPYLHLSVQRIRSNPLCQQCSYTYIRLLLSTGPTAEEIGCFEEPVCNDNPPFADRALSSFYHEDSAMTVEMCQSLVRAAGFKYAAVQSTRFCFGGNDISRYINPGNCNTPCAGNQEQNCGGSCVNRIFKVSTDIPTPGE